jgi:hypothetical protein
LACVSAAVSIVGIILGFILRRKIEMNSFITRSYRAAEIELREGTDEIELLSAEKTRTGKARATTRKSSSSSSSSSNKAKKSKPFSVLVI